MPAADPLLVRTRVRRMALARRLLRVVGHLPSLRLRLALANLVLRVIRPEYRVGRGNWRRLSGPVRLVLTEDRAKTPRL